MGILSAIERWQERRTQAEAIRMLNPYVFISQGREVSWVRWEIIPQAEAVGVFPKRDGSPVFMSKEECAAVNGGELPEFWGEVQFAWRDEAQKKDFHKNYPERFERKQQSTCPAAVQTTRQDPQGDADKEYPTDGEIEECWRAYKRDGREGISEFLEKQRQRRQTLNRK
jgi:hypothetical protein